MRAIGLGSITLATVVLTATDVRGANNNWCATYTRPANENCTFATFEQCHAQVWGLGGWCRPNPFPNTAFGTRSHRSRTPYWGTDWADTIRQVPTPERGIARTLQRCSFRWQAGYRSRTNY